MPQKWKWCIKRAGWSAASQPGCPFVPEFTHSTLPLLLFLVWFFKPWRFYICKSFSQPRKCVTSSQCKVCGLSGKAWRCQPENEHVLWAAQWGSKNQKLKNFFGSCAWWAIFIQVNGRHFGVHYPVLNIHPRSPVHLDIFWVSVYILLPFLRLFSHHLQTHKWNDVFLNLHTLT